MMIATNDLLHMYTTAKAVLHDRIATDLAKAIGRDFASDEHLRSGKESFDYFQGSRVSNLYGKVKTLRLLTDADVNAQSMEFLRTFWDALSDRIIESNLSSFIDVPVRRIWPMRVIEVDGFVDLVFDLEEGIRAYKATAF